MRDLPRGEQTAVTDSSSKASRGTGSSVAWMALTWVVLFAAAGAIATRLAGGPAYDWFLVIAAGATALVLAARIPARKTPASESRSELDDSLRRIFESAGPMMISIGLDGFITHLNPAAERLLVPQGIRLLRAPAVQRATTFKVA